MFTIMGLCLHVYLASTGRLKVCGAVGAASVLCRLHLCHALNHSHWRLLTLAVQCWVGSPAALRVTPHCLAGCLCCRLHSMTAVWCYCAPSLHPAKGAHAICCCCCRVEWGGGVTRYLCWELLIFGRNHLTGHTDKCVCREPYLPASPGMSTRLSAALTACPLLVWGQM